jgi:hypothetical protein
LSKSKQVARLTYYKKMAEHLEYVLNRRRALCVTGAQDVHEAQMNLDFHAITARRVFELVQMAKSKSQIGLAELLDQFSNRWPHLAKHRNEVLHIVAPDDLADVPQYIGGQYIANFEVRGGQLNYVIDPRHHHDELLGLLSKFSCTVRVI